MEKEYPASTAPVRFITKDGKAHNGFYLKDANKYVRNVNRWKDQKTDEWFDDIEVIGWEYLS